MKVISERRSFDRNAVIMTACVGVLFLSYVLIYSIPLQAFSYTNLYSLDINWMLFFVGLAAVLCISLLIPRETSAETVFLWSIYLVVVIPRVVLAACGNDQPAYSALCLVSFGIVAIASRRFKQRKRPTCESRSKAPTEFLSTVVVIVACAIVLLPAVVLACTLGFPGFEALNYENVYEIRAENDFGFWLSGFLSIAGTRLVPALIGFLLAIGSIAGAVAVTILGLLLFLWTANKAWFLLIILVWGLYYLMKHKLFNVTRFVALFSVLMLVAAIITSVYNEGVVLVAFSILIRRMIFVPAALGDAYFRFFMDGHSVVWLQNTILGFLTPMPPEYSTIDYQVLIGKFAMGGDVDTNANTGLFGGEFANFGPVGGFVVLTANLILICRILSFDFGERAELYMQGLAVVMAFLLLNASSIRLLFSPSGIIGTVVTLGLGLAILYASKSGKPENRSGIS